MEIEKQKNFVSIIKWPKVCTHGHCKALVDISSESIVVYVKRIDGLLAPRGPLAGTIHSWAINEANWQVQAVLREERGQKRRKYTKYDEV